MTLQKRILSRISGSGPAPLSVGPVRSPAMAIGAAAFGALAIGALAIGALAIGRLARETRPFRAR